MESRRRERRRGFDSEPARNAPASCAAPLWAWINEFYKHPAISAYRLNKLLYDSRVKPNMRIRLLQDVAPVAAEYGLRPEETAALTEVCKLPHNGTSQPGLDADPLVQIGAHPVGALMAVHVLQAEQRRIQRAVRQTVSSA